MAATIRGLLSRVGHVRLTRDRKVNNKWMLEIPEHAIQALNLSTGGSGTYAGGITYGTSFDHNSSVAVYLLGGGTSTGGTAFMLCIGTGAV